MQSGTRSKDLTHVSWALEATKGQVHVCVNIISRQCELCDKLVAGESLPQEVKIPGHMILMLVL